MQTRSGMAEGRSTFTARWLGRARTAARYLQAHPRLRKALQLVLVLLTLGFCAWAVRHEWSKAWPLLRHAKLRYVALSFATVAAYYLVFILGWMRLLDAWGIRIPYRVALQAEMVSMLAKYLPGGVWTPAARAIATASLYFRMSSNSAYTIPSGAAPVTTHRRGVCTRYRAPPLQLPCNVTTRPASAGEIQRNYPVCLSKIAIRL